MRSGVAAFVIAVVLGAAIRVEAQPSDADLEYEVKAALLLNFAKFVEWPPPSTPYFTIGVIGGDPFNFSLDRVVQGKLVNGRPVTIRRMNRPDDAIGCDVLFVSASERKRLPQVLSVVSHRPMLTVSDVADFTLSGGIIQFYEQDGRVRFEVNLEAARLAGLRLRSQLLNLARITEKRRPS